MVCRLFGFGSSFTLLVPSRLILLLVPNSVDYRDYYRYHFGIDQADQHCSRSIVAINNLGELTNLASNKPSASSALDILFSRGDLSADEILTPTPVRDIHYIGQPALLPFLAAPNIVPGTLTCTNRH
jgi:hypothetical protein